MANRVFQGVVYQMKDAIDRLVGVVDETGTIIACADVNRVGEVRDGIAADRLTAGEAFMRDGYTYHLFTANKRNDYAVMVEGTDEAASRYAALLAISMQNIKQYHDEKFDKVNFIKNVVMDNILPGDIYARARELHFSTDVSRWCCSSASHPGLIFPPTMWSAACSRTSRRTLCSTSMKPIPCW